jgi:hypothetical protein
MADIRDPRLLYLKGALFLGLGVLASGILLAEHPGWRTAALLAIAVWAFARAYYFAFYVVEHYIDPGVRFAGLVAFLRYLLRRRTMGVSAGPRPGDKTPPGTTGEPVLRGPS